MKIKKKIKDKNEQKLKKYLEVKGGKVHTKQYNKPNRSV